MLLRVTPFLLFTGLCIFLCRGLDLNPHAILGAYVGQKIPKFSLPILTGNVNLNSTDTGVFQNTDLKDEINILNVWASWCAACKDEQVFLLALANSGITIYGLNYKDNKTKALAWLAKWGNPYKLIGSDHRGLVALDLGVYATPETFIIDKHGVILGRYAGILNEEIWQTKFLPVLLRIKNNADDN